MTLPTSGPLSLSDIKGEFGGNASPALEDYYAGGAFVPAGTSGINGPVPSSGTIGIFNFYGTSSLKVTASNVTGAASGFSPSGKVNSSTSAGTTPTGGTSPYTYAWTLVSTSSGPTPTISSSTAQNPGWNATVTDGTPSVSTWKVTVTDAHSATANTTITVTLTWTNLS